MRWIAKNKLGKGEVLRKCCEDERAQRERVDVQEEGVGK